MRWWPHPEKEKKDPVGFYLIHLMWPWVVPFLAVLKLFEGRGVREIINRVYEEEEKRKEEKE